MSKNAAIPLLAAVLGGIALIATGPDRPPESPSPLPATTPLPEGAFISHDWFEPAPREDRRSLIPVGQNPTVTCTLPNCRNCQIHATWKRSL